MAEKYSYGPPWPIAINPSPSASNAERGGGVNMNQHDEIAGLRAENARLQERVEEGEQKTREAYNRMAQAQNQREMVLETGTTAYQSWRSVNDTLKRERDEARALAERRKRAGQVLTWFIRRYAGNSDPGEAVRKYGYAARAAIEEEEK